jgi:ABC-type multidrug transport system ATPase subunit
LQLIERFDRVIVMARGSIISNESKEDFLRKIREFSSPSRPGGDNLVSTRINTGGGL